MDIHWFISKLDAFLTAFSGALGVGGGIALIALVLKKIGETFVKEQTKHVYETLRIRIKEDYEREKLSIAHKQTMIETMVVQLHNFIKVYYMPIISGLKRFSSNLKCGRNVDAFLSLVGFLSAHEKMRSRLDGYFLQDLVGERVVSHLDYKFRQHLVGANGGFLEQPDGRPLIDRMKEDDMTIDLFMDKVKKDEKVGQIYERFVKWTEDEDKKRGTILFAETLANVFTLEVNLSYVGWYENVPPHVTTENLSLLKSLVAELLKDYELNDEQIKAYFTRLENYSV